MWKMFINGVISDPCFPVFSPNTGKYRPEKTPYLNTFHTVIKVYFNTNWVVEGGRSIKPPNPYFLKFFPYFSKFLVWPFFASSIHKMSCFTLKKKFNLQWELDSIFSKLYTIVSSSLDEYNGCYKMESTIIWWRKFLVEWSSFLRPTIHFVNC